MRVFVSLCIILLTSAIPLSGQLEEADPYSIEFVHRALSLYTQGVYVSSVDKNIQRLGDQVSIALLKIFTDAELSNPQIARSFLPVIQQSFSQPQLISMNIDKKPRVTLFLLNFLQREISDAQTKRNIEETIKFVEEKAAPN